MNFINYLNERERGSVQTSRYRKCQQRVIDWLEKLSASPVFNQPCEISGEPKATFLMDFSPDREKIASAHGDHTIRVTNINTGKCSHILTGHPRTPWCLSFHPSYKDILASGCLGGQVRIWDLRGGGSEFFTSETNTLITSLAFHPFERMLVFSTKNLLYVWDWTKSTIPVLASKTNSEFERIKWVKFDYLGNYLYTGISNSATGRLPFIHEVISRGDRQRQNADPQMWRDRQEANRQRYERLVVSFMADQQTRHRRALGLGPIPPPLPRNRDDRPTSPVHEDRLRHAVDYARYVTSHSQDNAQRTESSLGPERPGRDSVDGQLSSSTAQYSMFSRQGTADIGTSSQAHNPQNTTETAQCSRTSGRATATSTSTSESREAALPSLQPIGSSRSTTASATRPACVQRMDFHEDVPTPGSERTIMSSFYRQMRESAREENTLSVSDMSTSLTRDLSSSQPGLNIAGAETSCVPESEDTTSLSGGGRISSGFETSANSAFSSSTSSISGSKSSPMASAVKRSFITAFGSSDEAETPCSHVSKAESSVNRQQTEELQSSASGSNSVVAASVACSLSSAHSSESVSTTPQTGALQSSGASQMRNTSVLGERGMDFENPDGVDVGLGHVRYRPGSLQCQYLFQLMCHARGKPELAEVRQQLQKDVDRVQRLARASTGFQCNYNFSCDTTRRCPICKTLRVDFNRLAQRMAACGSAHARSLSTLNSSNSAYVDYVADRTSQTWGPVLWSRGTDVAGLDQQTFSATRADDPRQMERMESSPAVVNSTPDQKLQNIDERDLQRQLSETEIELSRVESSYHKDLQRLEENRRRILNEISLRQKAVCSSTINQNLASESLPAAQINVKTSSSEISGCDSSLSGDVCSSSVASSFSQSAASCAPVSSKQEDNTNCVNAAAQQVTDASLAVADSVSAVACGQELRSAEGAENRSESGTLCTLPGTSGSSQDLIEVLSESGDSETISFVELARRVANREDVTVVGNHRIGSSSSAQSAVSSVPRPSTSAAATASDNRVSSGSSSTFATLLRSCLTSSSAEVPSSSTSSSIFSRSFNRRAPVRPPVVRVEQAHGEATRAAVSQDQGRNGDAQWYNMENRGLHPHYSRSILDETINRPNLSMQATINRAIAGMFLSSGEQAVASNIVPLTHRIQRWDMRSDNMLDLQNAEANIVVQHCKIHNDASIDISRDSSLIATLVNTHGGFPDDNILAVFSLRSESFGQCLYTKSFGPNAISVSISPSNQFVLVGLASKRMLWIQVTEQLIGQIFQLKNQKAGENSMKHITDIYHTVRSHPLPRGMSPVSVNSARWLPGVGEGIIYGTNQGDLHMYRAGFTKATVEKEESRILRYTISTQTGSGMRHSAFTQTSADQELHKLLCGLPWPPLS